MDNKIPINVMRICIDRISENDVQGRIYSQMCPHSLHFDSCGQMLLTADRLMDSKGFPQTFQDKRRFCGVPHRVSYCAAPRIELDGDYILQQHGKHGTLDVLIQTRKRTGWQGIVKSEGSPPAAFHSEMELLKQIISSTHCYQSQKQLCFC